MQIKKHHVLSDPTLRSHMTPRASPPTSLALRAENIRRICGIAVINGATAYCCSSLCCCGMRSAEDGPLCKQHAASSAAQLHLAAATMCSYIRCQLLLAVQLCMQLARSVVQKYLCSCSQARLLLQELPANATADAAADAAAVLMSPAATTKVHCR
jgi:hypothetical protein